jgi:hypothetical protein
MSRLFEITTLPLHRKSPGYTNDTGDWIDGTEVTTGFKCNWQPYKDGNFQTILPEGIKSTDAFNAFTKTLIRTANQFTYEEADQTTYEGRRYYAYALMDWTHALRGVGSGRLDHYEVIFIRLPKNPGY